MTEIADKKAAELAIIKEFNLKEENYCRKIAKRRSVFDIRTEAMRTDGGQPKKGRIFNAKYGEKNGGVRVDEMIYGLKMAHVSCTDDSDERLEGSSPNSLAALEKLVGGDEPEITSRFKLSEILKQRFDLNLDCWIDETGWRKTRAIDTQGFIASNEDTIVLSYRFSTTIYDWMANLSFTSSEWKLDSDEALGHAGVFSSLRGFWTKIQTTGSSAYYNNFIYTIPQIRKYIIEPLRKGFEPGETFTPKKIYVVGCSLGAAISQIAFCFILDELFSDMVNPEYKRVDRLISVTAGCPRIGDRKFRKYVTKKMDALRELDRAVICRIVYNVDIVPHAPPNLLNFYHLDKLVYITKGGEHVMVNPDLSKRFTKFSEIKTIFSTLFQKKKDEFDDNEKVKGMKESYERTKARAGQSMPTKTFSNQTGQPKAIESANPGENAEEEEKTEFEKECDAAAEVIRDHMPFWYMAYLEKLKEEQDALQSKPLTSTIAEA
eukprot:CAMPEP_0116155186 /NCGR_PEP_ID=MMETSP0329-20121206/22175_1 /TAXON_ID=697910 /ORGANISM="Pseudo-nitzschia arenysensis, Strain B593" /LENGTH=489 /DNA_ID=CAMNT_0003652207 /DNA_START=107 /DNA_END=1580 /DNA_ORIENTATION=+